MEESVGGMPTGATGTVALPEIRDAPSVLRRGFLVQRTGVN